MRSQRAAAAMPLRVRRDPPTLAEAIFAAQGLTSSFKHQVEIAAGLMRLPEAMVEPAVAAATAAPGHPGSRSIEVGERSVVVERRRRPGSAPSAG